MLVAGGVPEIVEEDGSVVNGKTVDRLELVELLDVGTAVMLK